MSSTRQTTVKINKAELKKAIKDGTVTVEGIELVDGEKSIQFKTKSLNRRRKEPPKKGASSVSPVDCPRVPRRNGRQGEGES